MIHKVKCWPQFFQDIKSGIKTFEIRVNDRGYQVGDTLVLQEWDPEMKAYTGDEISRDVTYMLELDVMFETDNLVAMGIGQKTKVEETAEWVKGINCWGEPDTCSKCKNEALLDIYENYVHSTHCPHCGRKMKNARGVVDDENTE